MFLLIPGWKAWLGNLGVNFKFHYVSINSANALTSINAFVRFKFHYVSINSQ